MGLLAVTGLPAAAQGVYDPGIQEREYRQQERIQHGINSGQLTPGEAAHLERQQCRIRAAEDALKADGRLTRAERARLARDAGQGRPRYFPPEAQPLPDVLTANLLSRG